MSLSKAEKNYGPAAEKIITKKGKLTKFSNCFKIRRISCAEHRMAPRSPVASCAASRAASREAAFSQLSEEKVRKKSEGLLKAVQRTASLPSQLTAQPRFARCAQLRRQLSKQLWSRQSSQLCKQLCSGSQCGRRLRTKNTSPACNAESVQEIQPPSSSVQARGKHRSAAQSVVLCSPRVVSTKQPPKTAWQRQPLS